MTETSQPNRADLPASKASRPIAPLKPNEIQHPKELPATQLRAASNKSPFVRTGFKPKQARHSPDLQYSMVAWRGFLSALRAPRTLRLKPSGEFLKTAHRAVFLTEFHLIGSSPATCLKTKTAEALASAAVFLERTTGLEPATPTLARWCSTTELRSHCFLYIKKCRLHDLNTRPSDYKSDALPTELSRPISSICG